MIENLMMGFSVSLTLQNILYCFIGCLLGQVIGVLPGLGPVATISMLLTLTYKLDLTAAIIMLAGIYYGSCYGGTITSVLFKIPGEASTVVTIIDGYQMALKGRAGKALGIAAFGSFIAGTFGTIALSIVAPPLAKLALVFGPPEYATLVVLGLTLVTYLSTGSVVKSLLMAAVGLAIGTIGMEPATAQERFTFGVLTLAEGVEIAVLAMGIFGIAEILSLAESEAKRVDRDTAVRSPRRLRELLPDLKDWARSAYPIARGSVMGFFLGILPGGGAVLASFASYAVEKKVSRHPEEFGKGAIEGVAGPETANNAAVSGCFIPLLTLGIPTNVVMAVMMGAFMIHGVTPGPMIMQHQPQLVWGLITSMYIGNIILLILNIPLIRFFVKIMEIPFVLLSPLITLICLIGAYTINNNPVEILIMVILGVFGYFLVKFDYNPTPLMLAFILGPIFETAIRQSLIISQGNPMIFVSRPISASLLGVTILVTLSGPIMRFIKHYGLKKAPDPV
jgi:putative tricarboxylic transport membrane protein